MKKNTFFLVLGLLTCFLSFGRNINPDVNVGLLNILTIGGLSSNDILPISTNYDTPSTVTNNTNCVLVDPIINAEEDDYTSLPVSINGFSGGTTPSVFNNDTIDGVLIDPSEIIVTLGFDFPNGWILNPLTGIITVPVGTAPGLYFFNYSICMTASPTSCDTATVLVVIGNNYPAANPNSAVIPEDTVASMNILADDTDLDGNPSPTSGHTVDLNMNTLGIQSTITNATGVWTYNASIGVVTFTPSNDYNGTAVLSYTLCDNGIPVLCDYTNITVTVIPVNDAPVAVDDFNNILINTLATGNVITNDFDIDSSALTVVPLSTTVAQGTLTLLADGSYTFLPTIGFTGTVTFPYTIYDSAVPSASSTATLYIVVNAPLNNNNFTFNNLNYFPNPVKNNLTISNASIIDEVEITSLLGQKMISKKVNDLETEISLAELANGVYFVKVTSNGQEKTIKIVKK